LKPSYKTISNFRSDNAKSLRKANKDFVLLCKEVDLFGSQCVAVDGTFLKANASKSSIYTETNLKKQIQGIENKIKEYQDRISKQDEKEANLKPISASEDKYLHEKLGILKEKQIEKQALQQQLKNSEDTQISTLDPDARLLRKRGKTTAGYNAQSVTDAKYSLIVEEKLTNDTTDHNQLFNRLKAAKQVLNVGTIIGIADTGYYESKNLKSCKDANIKTYVPKQKQSNKTGRIIKSDFIFNQEGNYYTCPENKLLLRKGKFKNENDKKLHQYRSSIKDCIDCPIREKCLSKSSKSKRIYRWEHEDVLEKNEQRLKDNPEVLRKRGSIVEHPFGTIKQRAGMHHFLMRGLEKCQGEFSLMVLCYNFTRALNIIGTKAFISHCQTRKQA
jgi:hypothetical protein